MSDSESEYQETRGRSRSPSPSTPATGGLLSSAFGYAKKAALAPLSSAGNLIMNVSQSATQTLGTTLGLSAEQSSQLSSVLLRPLELMLTSGPEIRAVVTDYMKMLLSLFDILRTTQMREVIGSNRKVLTTMIPLLRSDPFVEMMKSGHELITSQEAEDIVKNAMIGQEGMMEVVRTEEFKAFSEKFLNFWDQAVKLLDKETEFGKKEGISRQASVANIPSTLNRPTPAEPRHLAPLSFYSQLLDTIDELESNQDIADDVAKILRRLARRHDVEITTLYQSFLDRKLEEVDDRLLRDFDELAQDYGFKSPVSLTVTDTPKTPKTPKT